MARKAAAKYPSSNARKEGAEPAPGSPRGIARKAVPKAIATPALKKTSKAARKATTNPTSAQRVAAILDCLQKAYPQAVCALNHRNAWELMVATILSAQCTDARVNLVTPALFKAFPTPMAMASASLPELEEIIRTTGFFRNKAKSLKGAGQVVSEEFGDQVPKTMDELLRIPGVARKKLVPHRCRRRRRYPRAAALTSARTHKK
jgi:endonuclease-3